MILNIYSAIMIFVRNLSIFLKKLRVGGHEYLFIFRWLLKLQDQHKKSRTVGLYIS